MGLEIEPRPELYFHAVGAPFANPVFVLRTGGDPGSALAAARVAVQQVDGRLALSEMQTMEDLVAQSLAPRRLGVLLVGLFAVLALVLAAIGLYGVMSYAVAGRTRELGVRMALGAQRGDVLRMVIGQGLALTGAGLLAGLALAAVLTRLMAGLLYGVTPTDPTTFAGVALILTAVALVACYLPARRATRLDPMVALRRG
jgi:putative ABC transport system permease protein